MYKLRPLTLKEIKNFASRPFVRSIAVENFLMTVHHNQTAGIAFLNLVRDAKVYKWDEGTINAIVDGIMAAVQIEGEEENEDFVFED